MNSMTAEAVSRFYCKMKIFSNSVSRGTRKISKFASKHYLKCKWSNISAIKMQCILYETEKIHKETLAKCVANGYLVISDKGVDITSKGIGEFETYISKQMKESNAKLVATIKIVTTVVIMATGIVAVIIQILGLI